MKVFIDLDLFFDLLLRGEAETWMTKTSNEEPMGMISTSIIDFRVRYMNKYLSTSTNHYVVLLGVGKGKGEFGIIIFTLVLLRTCMCRV